MPQAKPAERPADKGKQPKRDSSVTSPSLPVALSPIGWADQICVALPNDQLATLASAIRATRLRWEPGFASALVEGPLICGFGACGACPLELRRGSRLLCGDGPVFDLRDLALAG